MITAAAVDGERLERGGISFLYEVWGLQPDGYFCMTIRPLEGGKQAPFIDLWFRRTEGKYEALFNKKLLRTHYPFDWYWAPCAFSEDRRLKRVVLPSRVLFADLDWIPPHEVPFEPSYAWQTSPGKWQALWFADDFIEPDDFDLINRGLNRVCGADPGTWNRNRLLRVPGSLHLKDRRNG